MGQTAILGSLFLTAFAAATIFPAQSEALLAGFILKSETPVGLLIMAASLGNIFGSCLNWLFGRYIEKFKDRRWFPVSEALLVQAQNRYRKYGRWSLLLSWVPVIGDPITVVAGIMRERFLIFLAFVSVAKAGRYIVLAWIVANNAA